MIRMIQSQSGRQAKSYYTDALSRSDYYLEGPEVGGKFNGKLAERLGLNGKVTKEDFFALCENRHPKTGKPLTPRTKDNRTIGYDINFHLPKSASILAFLNKNNSIQKAFEKSVFETMKDIERDAKTRVRKNKTYDDRLTGELLYADFLHHTSRPVKGSVPDPHMHIHCFVLNLTYDQKEQRYKAGQFRDIMRDLSFYQSIYHKRLSDELIKQGYTIRKTKNAFEIEGVSQKMIDLFSKRTKEIEKIADDKAIHDPKKRGELGAKTRSKKQKGLTMSQLKEDWKRQINELTKDEKEKETTHNQVKQTPRKVKAKDCVEHTLSHSFERASVVSERKLLQEAYKHSIGDATITLDEIKSEFYQNKKIVHVKEKYKTLCTTKEVLLEEKQMVELAKSGKGKFTPLYKTLPPINLDGQQKEAIEHVLTTRNQISIIRGAAGTGKTTLMKEAIHHIEKAGRQVITIAPTAQASRGVLREEGFKDAETVAKFINDPLMQERINNQFLWVDEAGLLGTRDMKALLQIAKEKNARLILGGDTRQHASVVRGDALRILNTVAGIKTAEVSKIYRQKNEEYKKAMEHLSKGNIKEGFETLNAIDFIKSIDPLKPSEQLIDDYMGSIKRNKSALIVSPTHEQGNKINAALRQKLKEEDLIDSHDKKATKLSNLNLTEAQKKDIRNFQEGMVLQFNQNVPQIKRGSQWQIESIHQNQFTLKDNEGNKRNLPFSKIKKFDVFEKSEMGLSKGDKIAITRNGYDNDKRRLSNGQSLEVVSIDKDGIITVRNNQSRNIYNLPKNFGHISYAYCMTSHASQGKTVDEVFISQPSSTFNATNAKQFYVSASRAKDKAHIYTDDKEALLEYASQLGDRQSALELTQNKHQKIAIQKIREKNLEPSKQKQAVEIERPKHNKQKTERDYEPGW